MNKPFSFEIIAEMSGSLARAGVIHTPHGDIETPTFTVVGTHADVKFLPPENLREIGVGAVLSNGYHLLRRATMIDAAGGLAEFNAWRGPTLTDSGGFQVMSLGSGLGKIVSMDKKDEMIAERKTRKEERLALVDDEGVEFRDPYSSRVIKFTPEMSIAAQHKIGADVMMAFDELTNISDPYEYNFESLERTRKWAERSLREHIRQNNLRTKKPYQALYGVLQGGHWRNLREKAARDLSAMCVDSVEFDGFGLGGAFEKENLGEILSWMTTILPREKPRHLLGLSKPDDIFAGVENGCDTFDCVAPTREARHGKIYTLDGDISLKRAEFASDERPLDAECDCPTCCARLSRRTLREMLKSPDLETRAKVFTLLSQHNVRFIVRLTEQIRASIIEGNFADFRATFAKRYYHQQ
ncbi:tRNA guanosine(34) transglycosylase Tgt [Candidatus Saccharibacteria bacterium]|nr:tRNA guanosine(34) transglycosylase Tgt [Candidatus Saccharibacteria bacterium]MCL1962974.1 tRNA guanosine(34) transglycosylase Tgt [Candidatus Saccharibacteria bacterium]